MDEARFTAPDRQMGEEDRIRLLSVGVDGLWRWAFRESGQEESEIAYRRFWISLLQWLLSGSQFLPGADVSLTSARRYYSSEQPMQFLID